jgi:hypothetical protein
MVLRGPESNFPKLSRKEKKALKQEKKDAKKARTEERKQMKAGKKMGINPNHYDEYPMTDSGSAV